MKKHAILLSLILGLFLFSEARAQTPIVIEKGASSKTVTVTIPAGASRRFSIVVRRNQIINIDVPADVSANLTNGADTVDNWQDGEGFLSILTGRKGAYVFSLSNSSRRVRTFKMRVAITDNRDDYRGGTQ
jgi:hypothetical protein